MELLCIADTNRWHIRILRLDFQSENLGLHFHIVCVWWLWHHSTNWPLFWLIRHSFTPRASNCGTKQRSPLACRAAGTMWRGCVTPNNWTILYNSHLIILVPRCFTWLNEWVNLSLEFIQCRLIISKCLVDQINLGSTQSSCLKSVCTLIAKYTMHLYVLQYSDSRSMWLVLLQQKTYY